MPHQSIDDIMYIVIDSVENLTHFKIWYEECRGYKHMQGHKGH